jgi:hypothetical protein
LGARKFTRYHLYTLDQHGHIKWRKDLTLPDDQQAIEEAQQFIEGQAIELWSGTNLIARIDPKREPPGASGISLQ